MYGIGYIELLLLLLMVGFFVLVIGAGIAALIWFARRVSTAEGGSALRILRERYARGEISREEYEQMRDELRG